jgi:hypothetical protein
LDVAHTAPNTNADTIINVTHRRRTRDVDDDDDDDALISKERAELCRSVSPFKKDPCEQ